MHTLQSNSTRPTAMSKRPRRPSGIYRVLPFGGRICRALTTSRARKRIQTRDMPQLKGIHAFAAASESIMMKGGSWNGSLPDVRSRAKLSGYYAKKIAGKCISLGMEGADASLVQLTELISPFTGIGLYFIPQGMTRYEDFFGNPLPANLRTGLRGYPSLSLEFLQRFDDGSGLFERAKAMMEYQCVAYDGRGSFNSPSYPTEQKGFELSLEVQLTKLVNTFSAVLLKLIKKDGDPDNPEHTRLAAAAMVSVSGKDVCPKLTGALLSIIYPNTDSEEIMILVDMLRHPDPSALEKKPGADLDHARELLRNPVFRDLEKTEARARRIAAQRAQKQRKKEDIRQERERYELGIADTSLRSFADVVGSKDEADWGEETIPQWELEKKAAN